MVITMPVKPIRTGKRGSVVIPAELRRRYGIQDGSLVVAEPRPEGVLSRPAIAVPVEVYTPERKAEFLLSNAVDEEDYAWAARQVRALGLDPKKIPHRRPKRRT
jgi:bifunctional DNA-binding transcriptional regulator/antitoxin component of YhaV-PrlF toxin-antitoxin module